MTMTSHFASDYNAINLLRNGGLDFIGTNSKLHFWEIQGAALGSAPPANSYEIVTRNTQESELGAAKYLRFLLYSDDPVVMIQEFTDRFVQMAFVHEVGKRWDDKHPNWESGMYAGEPYSWGRLPSGKDYRTFDALYVRGTPLTVAFSLRVPQGRASMKMGISPAWEADIETPIQSKISTKDWVRPAKSIDPAHRRVRRLKIYLQRDTGAGTTEVHLGAFMMSVGVSSSLPYTGDPMADAIPKGTIVFAVGSVCPPGFERMDFTPPAENGRVFVKGGTPDLTVKGDEYHDHASARMTMNPERGWAIQELVAAADENNTPADSAASGHTHPIDAVPHVPPTKDVILCKRV